MRTVSERDSPIFHDPRAVEFGQEFIRDIWISHRIGLGQTRQPLVIGASYRDRRFALSLAVGSHLGLLKNSTAVRSTPAVLIFVIGLVSPYEARSVPEYGRKEPMPRGRGATRPGRGSGARDGANPRKKSEVLGRHAVNVGW